MKDTPLRQRRDITRLLYSESARTIGPLQILEAVDRDTRRACCELQQSGFLLCRPSAHNLPEPLDHLVVHLVSTIVRELVPVVPISLISTAARW